MFASCDVIPNDVDWVGHSIIAMIVIAVADSSSLQIISCVCLTLCRGFMMVSVVGARCCCCWDVIVVIVFVLVLCVVVLLVFRCSRQVFAVR